jgi:hypothetical protein
MACSEFRVYAVFTRLKAELPTVSVTVAQYFKLDGAVGCAPRTICPLSEEDNALRRHHEPAREKTVCMTPPACYDEPLSMRI